AVPLVDIAGIDGSYWRAISSASDGISLWQVTPDFTATLVSQTGKIDQDTAGRDLAHIMAVDHDPRPFYAFAQTDPKLWEIIEPLQGIRWLRTQTVFEALVSLIIEQHISWVSAQKSQRALLVQMDNKIHHAGRDYYTFPSTDQLAIASLYDLRELKITNKRKQLLIDLAGKIAHGGLKLESLKELPHAEAYQELMALKGIGHWTAANVVMRALGGYPYVTETDVALQSAANFYFNGISGKLTPKETHALFHQYGEFAGTVAYYTLLRWVLDRYPVNQF
ncbi:MAG TPA: hypothetical protein VHL11_20285, partial [Phototrophicaceae bacterium]|nr:hypothetical protein [Phototrophicaceae bacterium]